MTVGTGQRPKRIIGALGATLAIGLALTTESALAANTPNTAGPPTLAHGVQPTYTAGNITACPAGTTTFINTSDSGQGNKSASYSHDGTTFKTTVSSDGLFLSFTTNSPSFTVYVKGGPAYDSYDYRGTAYPSDTGLHSPFNNGRNLAAISHYLACGQPLKKASPRLATTPSKGGAAGTVILNDTGTLAGGASPAGSITFNLYDPSHTDCSGTPAYTQTVSVSGNGSYSTSNTTPASTAGTWSWTAIYSGDTNNFGAASMCGHETVTVTPPVPPGSCEGSGSISALVSGTNVTAYVPKGNWNGGSGPGIDVVNVEGSSITNTQIPTGTDVINSCASNSVTGQTVCTANNNDVYVLKGTGLDLSVSPNPLIDSGTGTIDFSGGSATTTGVSMDATDNKALIALSVGGTGGFQILNLATDTFESAFTTEDPSGRISEDPLIDPIHHLILSAAEDNNYELVNTSTSTAPTFFGHPVASVSGQLDSSAEDCATGIIFAPAEFSDPSQIEIADISGFGAVFTPGTPGSWSAPEQLQTLTGSSLSAGPSGAAVAQGTHTGVVAGEFGGDGLTALALPTTSGTGATPALSNWLTCETGSDPSGNSFSTGDDPHTMAAYQSPNGGDAMALLVNEGATEMVKVDLTDMLNPAIVPATGHVCNSGTLPVSAETFIPLS